MVCEYYNLREQPFGVTPNPRYLYFGAGHREALASLQFAVSAGRGFAALIARPGMGKTTLLFEFLGKLRHSARTVFLYQSQDDPRNFLRSLLADLEIDDDGSDLLRMHRALNDCLLRESKAGRQLVVVIDEAQNLTEPVLEAVRMLSNFETPQRKLMHLILSGQPQLAKKLSSPSLAQIRQRISIIARLSPLMREETQAYIEHRLQVSGRERSSPLFTEPAVDMIAARSEGIPRNINNICFNAMALGCALQKEQIDAQIVREVMADLDLGRLYGDAVAAPAEETAPPLTNEVAPGPVIENRDRLRFKRWGLRLALSSALVVAVALPFIKGSGPEGKARANEQRIMPQPPQGVSPSTSVDATTVLSTTAHNSAPVTAGPAALQAVRTVHVRPNETLFGITRRGVGKYTPEVVSQVRALNPWLKNLDLIVPGQKILLPVKSSQPSPTSAMNAESDRNVPRGEKEP